jgi:hypothetical protein
MRPAPDSGAVGSTSEPRPGDTDTGNGRATQRTPNQNTTTEVDTMKTTQEVQRLQVMPVRQRAFVLLAAVAVTLGAIATPLAGTADAGGLRGGVVLRNGAVSAGVETAGSKLGSGTDGATAAGDPVADTVETAGRKPGLGSGSGGISK